MKKLLSVLCIFLLMLNLTGCGENFSAKAQPLDDYITKDLDSNAIHSDKTIVRLSSDNIARIQADRFINFKANMENKKADKIRLAYSSESDLNSTILYDLIFDGSNLTLIYDNSRDASNKKAGIYKYENVNFKESKGTYKDTEKNSYDVTIYEIIVKSKNLLKIKVLPDGVLHPETKYIGTYETNSLAIPYTDEIAINDGCLVKSIDGNFHNINVASRFFNNFESKKADKMRVVTYTVEGGAIIYDYIYNGKDLRIIRDDSRDGYAFDGDVRELLNASIVKGASNSYSVKYRNIDILSITISTNSN